MPVVVRQKQQELGQEVQVEEVQRVRRMLFDHNHDHDQHVLFDHDGDCSVVHNNQGHERWHQ